MVSKIRNAVIYLCWFVSFLWLRFFINSLQSIVYYLHLTFKISNYIVVNALLKISKRYWLDGRYTTTKRLCWVGLPNTLLYIFKRIYSINLFIYRIPFWRSLHPVSKKLHYLFVIHAGSICKDFILIGRGLLKIILNLKRVPLGCTLGCGDFSNLKNANPSMVTNFNYNTNALGVATSISANSQYVESGGSPHLETGAVPWPAVWLTVDLCQQTTCTVW
jgi:hypothetical protein